MVSQGPPSDPNLWEQQLLALPMANRSLARSILLQDHLQYNHSASGLITTAG